MKKKVIIMGAAGRDFHNFNTCFRDDPAHEVVAFTAAQIPFIQDRTYPPELSGPLYPRGIPIYPEERLSTLIETEKVDSVVFSYSDVTNASIMECASVCTVLGADFILPGAQRTMLEAVRPVISVCAVRTGCGKSGITRLIAGMIKEAGHRAVAIRHPMPYGDLGAQITQRFATIADIRDAGCSIEEMEEYEPLVEAGTVVYAGVDYERILRLAEAEADVIVWDGGNNDLPFIRPDLAIVVADPLRPGHELAYYHGLANLRMADCVVINKALSAEPSAIEQVVANVRSVNADAPIIKTASNVSVDGEIRGKKVLVIEDGPTLTHGGMGFGAGIAAARIHGAEPVDARPYAVGSIRDTLAKYPRLTDLVPAMGYSAGQVKELEATINATPCDAVLVATPVDLARVIEIKRPVVRVRYEVEDVETPGLAGVVADFIKERLG
ncbi:MAG: cyclic 2,3-diphosphoglycerate synthase [Thermodesulfobacteriota bacterium]